MNLTAEEIKLIERKRQVDSHQEYQYLHMMEDIIDRGVDKGDRTGVGTRSLFGTNMTFDLEHSFPILTTKRVFWKGVVEELLWFIRGETDSNLLSEKGVRIWEGNTSREFLDNKGLDYPERFIGPGYGWQWRNWNGPYKICQKTDEGYITTKYSEGVALPNGSTKSKHPDVMRGIDQLAEALDKIKNNPDDRRILVSAWNPSQLNEMALPPCHMFFQFYVENNRLHCQWYQRSVDVFLGLPFNISSYALLTCLMAKAAGLTPGTLSFCGGDTHVYQNHFEQVQEQLVREPYKFPQIELPDVNSLEDIEALTLDDIKLIDYKCHKSIKAPMAV